MLLPPWPWPMGLDVRRRAGDYVSTDGLDLDLPGRPVGSGHWSRMVPLTVTSPSSAMLMGPAGWFTELHDDGSGRLRGVALVNQELARARDLDARGFLVVAVAPGWW